MKCSAVCGGVIKKRTCAAEASAEEIGGAITDVINAAFEAKRKK